MAISPPQAHWAASGFVAPSAQECQGKRTRCNYTFRDIVQLRVAKRLRDAGLSHQGLVKRDMEAVWCLMQYINHHIPQAPLRGLRNPSYFIKLLFL